MEFTKHATIRMRQRGKSAPDVALIKACGTRTADGYLLRNRDADEAIRALKGEINRLEHLKGTAVITEVTGEAVITVYAANRRKQRNLLFKRRHM